MSRRERLESYYQQVSAVILARQNPATGLIPASVAVNAHGDYRDAWVRDNVYSIMAVWGLGLAFRKIDDNDGRAYELEHATIKCMRGLLSAMIRQAPKVEKFKNTQKKEDALHAKYNTSTGETVVGDDAWGHLQIDATSIFILMLAQMTSSGLRIIYSLEEVHFIQNLVFYIERAYRTPDYGIWERGNKINHGTPELNSSSIGMALAALQAINNVNLFGARGGPASVIHVLPDEITRNYTTLHMALPRESNSKEIDAALLSVISFPAFAVEDIDLIDRTRNDILKKLGGKYGCKRFLRDGHQTVVEDTRRLHYEPHELNIFEGIECEWPLFFTYLVLDGLFLGDKARADTYSGLLSNILVDSEVHRLEESRSHLRLNIGGEFSNRFLPGPKINYVPELYIVPRESLDLEKNNRGSQVRVPNENIPLVWAQSLFILGELIRDDLLTPGDLDPLGRRLIPEMRQNDRDVVVQVVLLSESVELQKKLATFGLETQCMEGCAPITISQPAALRDAFTVLGEDRKLKLTGRPKRPIGTLSTCKIYRFDGRLYAFLPHFLDREEFYLVSDNDHLVSVFEQELAFIKSHWKQTGRPTLTVLLTHQMLGGLEASTKIQQDNHASHLSRKNLLNLMMSLRTGVCGGVRVRTGRLSDMINTSCIESLDFLVGSANEDREKWHSMLRGDTLSCEQVMKLNMNSVNATLRSTDTNSPGRKLTRRLSTGEHSQELKSPLTTQLYSDEPEYEIINGLQAATISGRAMTPMRGAPSNRAVHGRLVDASTLENETQRASYTFHLDALTGGTTTDDLSGATKVTLTLKDPSHITEAIHLITGSTDLYDQIDLLHYIQSCYGNEFEVSGLGSVKSLIEEVYLNATRIRQWSIVRQAAGMLRKVVNSLTINMTDILIRQKSVTVGFGDHEFMITSPMSPSQLADIIFRHCASDVREPPLVMEVLTYLGSTIRSSPSVFEGIMRIRIHFFIIAMREEISRTRICDEEEAVEYLMQMSPYEVKSLLGQILTAQETVSLTAHNRTRLSIRMKHLSAQSGEPLARRDSLTESKESPRSVTVFALSAGFRAGNHAKIEIQLEDKPTIVDMPYSRGLNVCLIDPIDGSILETATFDTHISKDESDEFARLIDFIEPGVITIICCRDDCYENLTEAAKVACENLGSSAIRELRYRDSWCIIGEKGLKRGNATEMLKKDGDGATLKISRTFHLQEQKENTLYQLSEGKIEIKLEDGTTIRTLLPSNGRWLRRRKTNGALNRVPKDFYPKVWKVLSLCQGILVGKQLLPRNPTIFEKTAEELNFALQVEQLLDGIRDPAERQVAVECLTVISKINERNPEIQLNGGVLDILKVVKEASIEYWNEWKKTVSDLPSSLEYDSHEKLARRLFYDLPQDGPEGTKAALAGVCVKTAFSVKWN